MARPKSYSDVILADRPTAYYRLDGAGGAGFRAIDQVARLDGTITGTVTPGPGALSSDPNGGMRFDGTTGYIDLGAPPSLAAITAAFTLEAWYYAVSAPTGAGLVTNVYPPTIQWEMGFGLSAGGNSRLAIGWYNAGWVELLDSGQDTLLNQWIYAAGTWDGTNLVLYRNGVQAAASVPGIFTTASSTNYLIGRRHDVAAGVVYFPGLIDEVAIYSRALKAPQVLAHYNARMLGPIRRRPVNPVPPFLDMRGDPGQVVYASKSN